MVGLEIPTQRTAATESMGAVALRHLVAAAHALEISPAIAERLFGSLTATWIHTDTENPIEGRSDISDDGTPLELSISLGKQNELRLLVEAQAPCWGLVENFKAGEALNDHLETNFGVNLDRYSQIAPLFRPRENGNGRFSMWHAAVARADGNIAFKVYLNPQIHGQGRDLSTMKEALARLHLPHVSNFLGELARANGNTLRCLYFSLDLDDTQGSRVKIYIPHQRATLRTVDRELAPLTSAARWDARQILRTLAGKGPFLERPILSCFGFREHTTQPQHTLHVPVRCYSPNDEEVLRRLEDLAPNSISQRAREVVEVTAERQLSADRGHITYVSVKRDSDDVNVTLYLSSDDTSNATRSRSRLRTASRVPIT